LEVEDTPYKCILAMGSGLSRFFILLTPKSEAYKSFYPSCYGAGLDARDLRTVPTIDIGSVA